MRKLLKDLEEITMAMGAGGGMPKPGTTTNNVGSYTVPIGGLLRNYNQLRHLVKKRKKRKRKD